MITKQEYYEAKYQEALKNTFSWQAREVRKAFGELAHEISKHKGLLFVFLLGLAIIMLVFK